MREEGREKEKEKEEKEKERVVDRVREGRKGGKEEKAGEGVKVIVKRSLK